MEIHFSARSKRGSISEFSVAFMILLLMVAFPLINLTAVGLGAASACALAHQAAAAASTQRRFSDSLSAMQRESNNFLGLGMASFLRMAPIGGYQGSGSDLYIDAHSYRGGGSQQFGPNTPVPPPVDSSTYVYEATVQLNYQVGPFLNLSGVPFIGSVPGIGVPAKLRFAASRAVEYPAGLEGNGGVLAGGGSVPNYNTTPSPDTIPAADLGPNMAGWNYPNIYDLIAAAGQTVLTTEVVQVPAILPIPPQSLASNWTNTGINVGPGQKVWIDLRSDGLWTTYAGFPTLYNANGGGSWNGGGQTAPDPSAPPASLIGEVGSSSPFMVGTSYLNYAPGQTGPVKLIFNDQTGDTGFTDNSGMQTVRIILTQ